MQEVFEKIKEKIRKEIEDVIVKDTYTKGKNAGLRKAEIFIDEVAAEYNSGWIPCSERLPEKCNRVLAYTDAGGYYIAHINGCGKFVCTAECVSTVIENSDVIAWQPLPDPYQPVSNYSTDAGTRYEKSAWRDLILRNFMRGSDA